MSETLTQDLRFWFVPALIAVILTFRYLARFKRTKKISWAFVILAASTPFVLEVHRTLNESQESESMLIPALLHEPTQIPIEANVPRFLVRALVFDFEASAMPVYCASQIVDAGTPVRFSSNDKRFPAWKLSTQIIPGDRKPLVMNLHFSFENSRGLFVRKRRMDKEPFMVPEHAILEDGSYAAELFSVGLRQIPGLAVFDGSIGHRKQKRFHLLGLVEPIADGDEVIELELESWWESHEQKLWPLLTRQDESETIRLRSSSRPTHWPILWVLGSCSPWALILLGTSLIVLRSLVQARLLSTVLFLFVSIGLILGTEYWRVRYDASNLLDREHSSSADHNLEHSAIRLAMTHSFADTALENLKSAWDQHSDLRLRQAIIAGLTRSRTERRRRDAASRSFVRQAVREDEILSLTFRAIESLR